MANLQNRVLQFGGFFSPRQRMTYAKLKYENPNVLLQEIQAYPHNNFTKCQEVERPAIQPVFLTSRDIVKI